MSRCRVEGLHLANSAALLQHIPTTDAGREQSYHLISGRRCLLIGLRQVGTQQAYFPASVFFTRSFFVLWVFFFFFAVQRGGKSQADS